MPEPTNPDSDGGVEDSDTVTLSVGDPATGKTRLLSRQCDTCVSNPATDPAYPEEELRRPARPSPRSGSVICRDRTCPLVSDTHPAICRGFADRYTTQALRLITQLWGFTEVDPPTDPEPHTHTPPPTDTATGGSDVAPGPVTPARQHERRQPGAVSPVTHTTEPDPCGWPAVTPAIRHTTEVPVATPTLIGVAEPRGAYTARHLTYGDHPDILVPPLRRIWTQTFTRDTTTMTAALLAHDWYALATNPRRLPADRQPPVAGVGYPTPAGDDTRHRPARRGPRRLPRMAVPATPRPAARRGVRGDLPRPVATTQPAPPRPGRRTVRHRTRPAHRRPPPGDGVHRVRRRRPDPARGTPVDGRLRPRHRHHLRTLRIHRDHRPDVRRAHHRQTLAATLRHTR